MVTGLTKSGKTVLAENVFPRLEVVWFDGGAFTDEEDFWSYVVDQLNVFPNAEDYHSNETTSSLNGRFEGQLGLPFLGVKPSIGAEFAQNKTRSLTKSRQVTNKIAALNALREKKIPLIIDNFHYIKREKQGLIVRALKPLIFQGLPVVFIAIPHRMLDAIRVEKEMTGRLEQISIPSWDIDELISIPEKGFPLLNMKIDRKIFQQLASESFGSPHLMQEFCREICREYNVIETLDKPINIQEDLCFPKIFRDIAQNTGKVMFEKLAKGPRQRTDRISRTLKNGNVTNIYGVVLYALSEMKPGIQTIDYENLRTFIKTILHDNIPQAHEISRVLDHMAKISASDESSTPVIDWDKEERLLHITDPFFAYFLRWGL